MARTKTRASLAPARSALALTLGAVLLLGSFGSFAAVAVSRPAVAAAQEADGLTLFRPLMRALTSPRCFNCHGGTDPVSGANHGGGAVGAGAVCAECHTGGPWDAVSGIPFDQQVLPMCETMRHVVEVLGPDEFVRFLGSDPVVGLGFEGLRGLSEASPFWPVDAEPPPIDQFSFVSAAQRWVTEGKAECTRRGWNGTIVQRTNLRSVSQGSELSTDLTITVNVTAGEGVATVHMAGRTIQDGPTVQGCQTYNRETFTADGTHPAVVEIAVQAPLPAEEMPELPPGVSLPPDIPDPRQGGYFINFGVPQLVRGTHHIERQFVTLPPRSACEKTVEDPPYAYAARGGTVIKPLADGDPNHLVGTDIQTINGSTIETSWDLTLD